MRIDIINKALDCSEPVYFRPRIKTGFVTLDIKDPEFIYCSVCGMLRQKKLEFVTINYTCRCTGAPAEIIPFAKPWWRSIFD